MKEELMLCLITKMILAGQKEELHSPRSKINLYSKIYFL